MKTIAQPLYGGARDEDTAFERVLHPVIESPGYCRNETVARLLAFRPRVHQHETSGAVGVLDHSGLETRLTKEGSLLISRNAKYGDICPVKRIAAKRCSTWF